MSQHAEDTAHRVRDGAGEAARRTRDRMDEVVGGPARRQVLLVLASVLALDTADKGATSAVAGSLKSAFGVGNTDIGILISVVSLVGAVFTLPIGKYVDRVRRTRLLWISISMWSAAMIVSGTATSFTYLLVARVFLGVVTATAAPAVASLVGDYFPAKERGRIYGLVLGGELVGLGAGFMLAGVVSSFASWRWAYWCLAPISVVIAWVVYRYLPEPARGGQSWLRPGADHITSAEEIDEDADRADDGVAGDTGGSVARDVAREEGIEPVRSHVKDVDPADTSLWWAVKYVLSIRTNVVLIIASALVYFYFAGLRGFAIIFVTHQYGISRATATSLILILGLGALAGVYVGGRASDWLIERGRFNGRILVGSAAIVLTVVAFAPGIWSSTIWIAIPLFTAAAFALAGANPPIDAARLDIMHPHLWGRAESVRQFLRALGEASAPALFGYTSSNWFGGREAGLQDTFLVMLAPVLLAAVVLLYATRTYDRDVATAAAYVDRTLRDDPVPSEEQTYPHDEN